LSVMMMCSRSLYAAMSRDTADAEAWRYTFPNSSCTMRKTKRSPRAPQDQRVYQIAERTQFLHWLLKGAPVPPGTSR
jgi:hypothetical protein